jgi:hypothetical protein
MYGITTTSPQARSFECHQIFSKLNRKRIFYMEASIEYMEAFMALPAFWNSATWFHPDTLLVKLEFSYQQ